MNLVLHGLFFQVIVSIVQLQHGSTFCSAGEPGYLDFDNLPETNFSCQGKVIGGYYADVEAGCQMFHVCTIGQKDEIMDIKFLCLNGTVFDQETRVCERVDEVDCSKSERFYNLNLELYGNNAVTLSLHDTGNNDEDEPTELIDDSHESQRTTSASPSTTSTTTTTTPRPIIASTTSASGAYQHPNGYPQHYQPQPRFPSVQTSQSKSLYDDKNGGYHQQYIYHTGDHRNNNVDINNDPSSQNRNNNNNNNPNQATSYQLFNNQGVISTTGPPQIHQIRYSSTANPQIQIHNDHQPTVPPIFHATSSMIQTLLNSNANSPSLINPIFHNHGISSTTEQFTVHNNNPRETDEYHDNDDDDTHDDRIPLEAVQPTTQGKVSKLKISPIPEHQESINNQHQQQNKDGEITSQQQRITTSFLPTASSNDREVPRSFYPTPKTSIKSTSSHVTHIHLPPPPTIPQLKPHQVTINLSPPEIQHIVQNPSPLLPSQSRVIVTAKASVSDESGRSLNTTQLVTLPLPTIPASYDDYKEGDESFDPFYRDVPKIRNDRRAGGRFRWPIRESRDKRSARGRRDVENDKMEVKNEEKRAMRREKQSDEVVQDTEVAHGVEGSKDFVEKDAILPEVADDFKTMTSRHQLETNSEKVKDGEALSDAREIEEGEYVDSVSRKSSTDSREIDDYANPSEETFDGKLFDEPESQTSKEIDTRAVTQRDSKYPKNHANHFDKDEKKSKNSHDFETSGKVIDDESSRFSLELPEVIDLTKSNGKHSVNKLKGNVPEEEEEEHDEEEVEEKETDEREISREENFDDDYYYESDMDTSSLISKEEDSEEYSKESPNRIHSSSRDHESSVGDKTFKLENHRSSDGESRRGDKSRKIKEDYEVDYSFSDASTTQSNEEMTSFEMSDEYMDDGQLSHEDSREIQDDENDHSMPRDNPEISKEINSEEATTTTEKMASPEDSTIRTDKESNEMDGVLKFTDEIPTVEEIDETEKPEKSVSSEETPQDYIDDNYEPQSYKEKDEYESTTESGITEKIGQVEFAKLGMEDEMGEEEMSTTEINAMEIMENMEEKLNNEPKLDKKLGDEEQVEKSVEKPIEEKVSSTSSTTTTTTTTTSTTTTTTTMRTTTSRPTSPKLFRPFTIRKNYVYVPPSNTPVPVIIKPRLTLLNPKPAKPLKSYNDFAPKPIIRKSPLFVRKTTTTARTTTPRHQVLEISTEIPVATENPKFEKNISFTTEVSSTEIPESSLMKISSNTSDEIISVEEKYFSISTTDSVETLPVMETQTFTPYPLLRMTEASLKVEKNLDNYEEATKGEKIIGNDGKATEEEKIIGNDGKATEEEKIIGNDEQVTKEKMFGSDEQITKEKMFGNDDEAKKEKILGDDDKVTKEKILVDEKEVMIEKIIVDEENTTKEEIMTTEMSNLQNNNVPSVSESGVFATTPETPTTLESTKMSTEESLSVTTEKPQQQEIILIPTTSDSSIYQNNVAIPRPESNLSISTKTEKTSSEKTTEIPEFTTTLKDALTKHAPTLSSIRAVSRKPSSIKRIAFFNCLEKDMYRFYADGRDCRLFHYCSPGFTSRQVLDFRFVCEEGTAFDEQSQSCVHDLKSPNCRKRVW